MNKTLGLYLHIPFCLSKCGYCDFYSIPCPAEKETYVQALCRAIRDAADAAKGRVVDTVFFGGGTPSLLSAKEFECLMRAVGAFSVSEDCEVTLEVNPATVTRRTLCAYRALGANRLSVGMQASSDERLSALGRRHTMADTRACVEDARAAGFDNLSLDLMYGLPEQTVEEWEASLSAALALSPTHLSLYALSLCEGVPLFDKQKLLPDDECQRALYDLACDKLLCAGLQQYEISNFACSGYACRHNLRYWRGEEYLGFGPAAASHFERRRYTEAEDVSAFCRNPCGLIARIRTAQPMGEEELFSEALILRLRLSEGLPLSRLGACAASSAFLCEVQRLQQGGFCRLESGVLTLTRDGFFVSNEILSRLLCAAGL